MNIYIEISILFGVGLISGFLNIMAGGGSSLTLPAMIFLGMDSSMANGTNRIGVLMQNITAIISFKHDNAGTFKYGYKMSFFALPGALVGTLLAVRVEDELFNKILALIMLGILVWMLIPKKKLDYTELIQNTPTVQLYFVVFLIGFYIGFIQVGVGFIIMAVLYYYLKVSLVQVNIYKVMIVLIAIIPSIIVFAITDNIHYGFGIVLGIGNAIGGWFAAKLQVKKGDKVIKYVLSVAIFIISLKLLGVF